MQESVLSEFYCTKKYLIIVQINVFKYKSYLNLNVRIYFLLSNYIILSIKIVHLTTLDYYILILGIIHRMTFFS